MERTMGLEPTTFAMARQRSSQLSYVRTRYWNAVIVFMSEFSSRKKTLFFFSFYFSYSTKSNLGAGGRVRTGTSKG